jgi:hypothetical protein
MANLQPVFPVQAMTDDGRSDGNGLLWSNENSSVGRKLLMPGDPGQLYSEIDARRHIFAFLHLCGGEPDIVRICDDAYATSAIESDIEFAR